MLKVLTILYLKASHIHRGCGDSRTTDFQVATTFEVLETSHPTVA